MFLPGGSSRGITVLHVDDDLDFTTLVQQMLQNLSDDITVVTAHSVEAALTHLNGTEAIDCVVSDYEMPESDGLDLLRRVQIEWPDLPFILFTGKGTEDIAEEAIQLGVTDYLQKRTGQSQFSLLANRVENVVRQNRAETRLKSVTQQTRTQFGLLVDAVEEYAILLLDEDGTVQTWNAGAKKIKGYGSREIIGEHFSRFYRPEDVAAGVPERNLRTAVAEGECIDTGWRVRKDGSEFWANVTEIRGECLAL